MLRVHQLRARSHQILLRIEHVERRALSYACLFAHAVERDFGRCDLCLSCVDRCLGRLKLTPSLDYG